MKKYPPLEIRFRGIAVSAETVLTQGYFETNTINEIREELRRELLTEDLDAELQTRYKNTTAHTVILRFMTQPKDPSLTFQKLEELRTNDLGVSKIEWLYLVEMTGS